METAKISFDVETSDAEYLLGVEIWIDNNLLLKNNHVQDKITFVHDISDNDGEHELRVVLTGKTSDHTQIDKAGTIIKDATLTISNFEIDGLDVRLRNALDQRLLQTGRRIDELDRRLVSAGSRVVERAASSVQQAESRLKSGLQRRMTELETNLVRQAAVLESLSPLKVLSRGYSVTLADDGKRVVRSASEIVAGDAIETRLPDGRIISRVEEVRQS